MKHNPNSDEAHARLIALIEEIEGQTDRGAAIVGAAWVEEALSAAIESFLHSDSKSWQRLFGANNPMSTFSAKIDLSSLLGMISEVIRSDLHIIRDVRNEFAHQIAHKTQHTKLGFNSPHIRDKCLALKSVAHEEHTEGRTAFVRACAIINSDFEMMRFVGMKISDSGQIFAKVERET